jgi:hypothetical protein
MTERAAKVDAKAGRLTWRPLKQMSSTGSKYVYPFLDDDSRMDVSFVRVLLTERPYKATYGAVSESWDRCCHLLQEQKDPDGELIFHLPLKAKSLKTRFEAYMEFVKTDLQNVPFRSGCDDEEAPGEIKTALEDIYEDWMSFNSNQLAVKMSDLANKQKDRDAAEKLKQAALGTFVKENKKKTNAAAAAAKHSADDTIESDDDKAPVSKKSKTAHPHGFEALDGFNNYLKRREERKSEVQQYKTERLQQKARKLDIEELCLTLEKEKLDAERPEREASIKEREANIKLMTALAASMLSKSDSGDSNKKTH